MNTRKTLNLLKSIEFALENPEAYEAKRKRQELMMAGVAWIGLFISFFYTFRN